MDYAGIHVILLDHRVLEDRYEPIEDAENSEPTLSRWSEPQELHEDIKSLLKIFKGGKHRSRVHGSDPHQDKLYCVETVD